MRRERSGHKSAPRQLVDEVQYRGWNILSMVSEAPEVTEIRNMALGTRAYSRSTVDFAMYLHVIR